MALVQIREICLFTHDNGDDGDGDLNANAEAEQRSDADSLAFAS